MIWFCYAVVAYFSGGAAFVTWQVVYDKVFYDIMSRETRLSKTQVAMRVLPQWPMHLYYTVQQWRLVRVERARQGFKRAA